MAAEAATSRLTDLANEIAHFTKIVDDYITSQGITLSFDVDAVDSFPTDAPPEVLAAQRIVKEATSDLNQLVTGPAEHLRWHACLYHDMSSLRYIYHFKLAEHIPLTGSLSFAELASKANVDELQARRVLRHAMTNRLFREPEAGWVAHTAGSALLVRNRGVRDWVGYTTEESFLCASKVVEATEKWGVSERKDQTAYNLAFDTTLPMFEHIGQFPERAKRFANTMIDMTSTDGYNIRHLVNGFDWNGLDDGSLVIDVGGSTGHASIAIAEKNPHLKFLVQDLPDIVAQGQELLNGQPNAGIRERISFETHDFFTPQPQRDAAVYLLRFILHDHPDSSSVNILKSIVPSLRPGARLVVMDGVLPEPNTLPRSEERTIRIMDMEMMTTFNSCERDQAQWEALFQAANPQLKLKNVVKPEGSVNSVMEIVLEDDRAAPAADQS